MRLPWFGGVFAYMCVCVFCFVCVCVCPYPVGDDIEIMSKGPGMQPVGGVERSRAVSFAVTARLRRRRSKQHGGSPQCGGRSMGFNSPVRRFRFPLPQQGVQFPSAALSFPTAPGPPLPLPSPSPSPHGTSAVRGCREAPGDPAPWRSSVLLSLASWVRAPLRLVTIDVACRNATNKNKNK